LFIFLGAKEVWGIGLDHGKIFLQVVVFGGGHFGICAFLGFFYPCLAGRGLESLLGGRARLFVCCLIFEFVYVFGGCLFIVHGDRDGCAGKGGLPVF
jgi:hypothetical protein